MTLTEAREAIAAALTDALDAYTVAPRPSGAMQPGTGWVNVASVEPGDMLRTFNAALLTVLVLSGNEQQAELEMEAVTLPALAALDQLPVFAVSAEPATYLTGQTNAGLYVLTINATLEVQ